MKELIEKRNGLLDEMDNMLNGAKEETRALNEEENTRFEEIRNEIASIDNTLKVEEEARGFEKMENKKQNSEEEVRALEEDKFLRFVRGEERALDVSQNGAVIPTHVANKIIDKVKELSPIYAMATVYNVGGNLVFPVYDEATSSIGAAYQDDMAELTEGTGKFTTVKLENFIVGVLAKVSKSLTNRTEFDLLSFVIGKVAQAIAEFLEKELIVGTAGKMEGVLSATQKVTAASASAITADELIDLQMTVPQQFQDGAVFILNKETFKAVRKLKNNDGEYLLNKNIANGFGWDLLGKPVHVSESVPTMAASAKVVAYGDMSGLYVKLAQDVEIQILNEKYATQHAKGVVGYVEADSKIVEQQKIAVLEMAAV